MRIALIGVSGSGKTSLGEALSDDLDLHLIEHQSEACIHSIGGDGDFHTALAIHCLQWEEEQELSVNFITDGSAVERVAHALLDYHVKSVAADKEVRDKAVMAKIAVEFLSALAIDSWSYDHAFYLPLTDSAVIPEGDPVASSSPATISPALYETAVDELIPLVLEDLKLNFVTLEGSPEDRLAEALRRVRGDEDGTSEALHE